MTKWSLFVFFSAVDTKVSFSFFLLSGAFFSSLFLKTAVVALQKVLNERKSELLLKSKKYQVSMIGDFPEDGAGSFIYDMKQAIKE